MEILRCAQDDNFAPKTGKSPPFFSHGVLREEPKIGSVLLQGDAGGRLVIDAGNEAAGPCQRPQPLEFPPHRLFPFAHHHLVVVPHHAQLGKLATEGKAVDPRLPLQRQHPAETFRAVIQGTKRVTSPSVSTIGMMPRS